MSEVPVVKHVKIGLTITTDNSWFPSSYSCSIPDFSLPAVLSLSLLSAHNPIWFHTLNKMEAQNFGYGF